MEHLASCPGDLRPIVSIRAMTVKKTGTESNNHQKTSPRARQYDAKHPDQLSYSSDLYGSSLADVRHKIEQECSIDSAKIVEVNRRIVSGEYNVSGHRIVEKLFDLELQLRIMDNPTVE